MTYSFSSLNRSRYLAMAAIVLAVLLGLFAVWRFVIPSLQGDSASTRAEDFLKASDYDSAIAELEAALQVGESPKVLAQLIQAYALKGNATGTEQAMYAKAYPLAKQATEKYPDNVEILLAVGYLAETAGYYEEAGQYYIKASSLDEDNAQILFRIAHTLEFITENSAAAEALYQKAYELDSENSQILMAMGRMILARADSQEDIENAFGFFMAAAERTEQASIRSEAWTNAAQIQLARNQYEEATALASMAVNADRAYAPALVAYGEAIFREGRTQDGLNYIAEAMEKNPRHSDSYYTTGILLRVLGDYEQSVKYFILASQKISDDNTIVSLDDKTRTSALIQYDIAKTYDMAGDIEKSFSALEQAVATDASAATHARIDAASNNFFSELATQERFTSLVAE